MKLADRIFFALLNGLGIGHALFFGFVMLIDLEGAPWPVYAAFATATIASLGLLFCAAKLRRMV